MSHCLLSRISTGDSRKAGSRAEELDSTVLRTLSIKVKFGIGKLNIKNMKRLGIPWLPSGQDFMLPGSGGLGSVPDWGTQIPRTSESESPSVVFNSL